MANNSSAQTTLSGGVPDASEKEKARLAKLRGEAAAKIQDPEKRRAFIAKQGDRESSGGGLAASDYARMTADAQDTIATDGENVANNAKVLGSYKKGGKVKKTGLYKLHKKERVLNKKQTAALSILSGKK